MARWTGKCVCHSHSTQLTIQAGALALGQASLHWNNASADSISQQYDIGTLGLFVLAPSGARATCNRQFWA
ncbi:hypothetical protein BJX68DRAFT_231671 [Aspergillus pseudodeflectus]|uniref:Uncharacterized protein n=1 Tax=Aspergillus pseudodeflectus TaxID=176178 RepID=A0ABR4KV95_9EURO